MHDTDVLLSLRDWLRWAGSRFAEAGLFYGHGTDNAWDEALALILPALHLPLTVQPDLLSARLTPSECKKLADLITRRIEERIPVPYLTHQAWFAGLAFYVDERVLIPRSSFAELIEQHFEPWLETDGIHRILDLCTGSGCMAIACAEAFPEAAVDAADLSGDALAVARLNVTRHGKEQQVTLFQSDLFNALPARQYDLIISNPPYVDADDMASLPTEYRHEPALGLAGGDDGLDLVTKILQQAGDFLAPHGIIMVETGNSEIALNKKFPDVPFVWVEFERGNSGIFLLDAEALKKHF